MNELEEAIKLFGREDLLGGYGIQDTDTNIEVFMSIKDMVKYYRQDLEIERLNNIIEEQYKELELERKSRKLLTDDLANVCKISLKKDNTIKEVREYIENHIRIDDEYPDYMEMLLEEYNELLEILDKEKE